MNLFKHYEKKPYRVSAIRLENDVKLINNLIEIIGRNSYIDYTKDLEPVFSIDTYEGTMRAYIGDYIAVDQYNDVSVYKEEEFNRLFREIK